MSRRVISDANSLLSFFEQYSLKEFANRPQQKSDCKTLHKKLYGLMVFFAELKANPEKVSELNAPLFRYFDEVISDALLSIFSWAQGAYKPAKLELRCAIENTLKALLSVGTPDIISEKRVYAIFDTAKKDRFFSTKFGSSILNELEEGGIPAA